MAGPGLAAGTFTQGKAILWLSISYNLLANGIGSIAAVRSRYRSLGFWHTHACHFRPLGRLAGGVYQPLAAGAAMEPF